MQVEKTFSFGKLQLVTVDDKTTLLGDSVLRVWPTKGGYTYYHARLTKVENSPFGDYFLYLFGSDMNGPALWSIPIESAAVAALYNSLQCSLVLDILLGAVMDQEAKIALTNHKKEQHELYGKYLESVATIRERDETIAELQGEHEQLQLIRDVACGDFEIRTVEAGDPAAGAVTDGNAAATAGQVWDTLESTSQDVNNAEVLARVRYHDARARLLNAQALELELKNRSPLGQGATHEAAAVATSSSDAAGASIGISKPDWRVGLHCTSKAGKHIPYQGIVFKCLASLPSGTGGINDPEGVVLLEMINNGEIRLRRSSDMRTVSPQEVAEAMKDRGECGCGCGQKRFNVNVVGNHADHVGG